ncbi:MAG: transglycosylase SLT domain-containing protein [Gammaproteobacteria bacterium]|jgi:membrane-bound lytic murein transglycosylase D
MKKTIVTFLSVLLFVGCQSTPTRNNPDLKESSVISEQGSTEPSVLNLLDSLDSCYLSNPCKEELQEKLDAWLLNKDIVTSQKETETEHLSKIVTVSPNTTNDLVLSSDYMNNELVKGALNEWLTWKRPQLINTWHYYQFFRDKILPEFNKFDIQEALVLGIMSQESGGRVHSNSRAGAAGLFQLMPATAKRLGATGNYGAYDARYNPYVSAEAAAKYINEQLALYDGDVAKMLAAYNSGENRFARMNKSHANKSIWDKNFFYELPHETRYYIPTVIAAMLIFQSPEKFNVSLHTINTQVTSVIADNDTSLSELAACFGQEQREEGWFRVLRNLNFGIKADKTIKSGTEIIIPESLLPVYQTNCQNSEFMKMAKSFHDSDFKNNMVLISYRVKQGDSLNKIARKFRCTSKTEIARINKLKAPNYLIRAGKYLKIPQC